MNRARNRVGLGWRGAAIVLLSALASTGCYRTVPLGAAAPAAGTRVRVELTREGTLRLSELIGPGVASVEGETRAVRADTWELLLTGARLENGNEVPWRREPIALPAVYIASAGERRIDRAATGLAIAAFTAGAFLATRLFQGGVLGGDDGDGGDIPPG
jgi:hypothetical protein